MTRPDVRTARKRLTHTESLVLQEITKAALNGEPAPSTTDMALAAGCGPATASRIIGQLVEMDRVKRVLPKKGDHRRVFEVKVGRKIHRTSISEWKCRGEEIPCLKCEQTFKSIDKICNRICEKCKASDGWKSGVSIQGFAL